MTPPQITTAAHDLAEPRPAAFGDHSAAAILNAVPDPVLAVDADHAIRFANHAAEQFLSAGAAYLRERRLDDFFSADTPLFDLINHVRSHGVSVSEHGVTLESPRIGVQSCTIQAAPLGDATDAVVLTFHRHAMVRAIDRQLTHRGAARSVTAMAAMLAHEVKNPLSGIRGAAQLLGRNANPGDRCLAQLICDETDRICALVDRIDAFADHLPAKRAPINIHAVLEHVRRVAAAGFASHVRFREVYDPSLPPVLGDRDLLVQALLNLVKNAAEAAPEAGAEITLSTAFRDGLRLAVPGADSRLRLPLAVSVADNGGGVAADLKAHLFDPFVSTKTTGGGLGLALVAKVVQDHGGLIEFDTSARGATFRIMLPIAADAPAPDR